MNIINLLIVLLIIYIIYFVLTKKSIHKKMKNKTMKYKNNKNNKNNKKVRFDMDNTNKYFSETQYNSNYSDTIDAFNLISLQKHTFNTAELPITKVTKIGEKEAEKMANNFINELNNVIGNPQNNWATNSLEKPVKSGWNESMKELGLPSSIYNEPAEPSKIKLIKIDYAEKVETDSEIELNIYMVIQKLNTDIQMVIKISLLLSKNDVNLEREFFDKTKNTFETKIIIQNIFVVGFLLNEFTNNTSRTDFYNFTTINDGKMMKPSDMIKELNRKRN
jgi:hypothetical protein